VTRALRVVVFALLAVVYFSVFPYNAGLNNPNENARIYTTIALVEEHTPRIDAEVARFGHVNDDAVRDGHEYAAKAPGTSLAGVPVYALFRVLARHVVDPHDARAWLRATTLALRLLVVQLPCFLFLVWFHGRLRRDIDDPALPLVATAALAVGTNFLAYALMFASHSLIAIAAFAAFALASERRRPFVVGNLIGFVTLLEYQAAPLSLVLGLYALVCFGDRRARLAVIGGAALHALVLGAWQWAAFGGPLRTPYPLLADESLRAGHVRGFVGVGLPSRKALRGLLFDPVVGLFGTSPVLWLLVPFGIVAARRDPRARWAAAAMIALVVVIAGVSNWRGGWSVGPRYLVGIMPLAVWTIAVGAAHLPFRLRRITSAVVGGLAAASALTIGLVSIVINTLPYDVHRPLAEVALPLIRAGFLPYHALPFVLVACALLLAPLLASFAERAQPLLRAVVVGVAALAAWPALVRPRHEECPHTVARLTEIWEPAGRDALAPLRARAVDDPCLWPRAARLERALCWQGADEDELRAFGRECPSSK
jgi:hypothetical protein